MIRQTDDGPVIDVRQFKTGVALTIPVHPDLQAIIDATPSEHLLYLTTPSGKPFTAEASASGSARGATRLACRTVRRMVYARRVRGFWRNGVAPRMKSRPSPGTHRCARFRGTPRLSIRPDLRSRR